MTCSRSVFKYKHCYINSYNIFDYEMENILHNMTQRINSGYKIVEQFICLPMRAEIEFRVVKCQ